MKNINRTKKEKISLTKEKKRNIIIGAVSACLVVIMTLSIVLPIVLKKPKYVPFQIPALSLPIEEQYALHRYSYADLSDTVVTLRSDIMNITKRNLPRPTPELLEDEFSLVYYDGINKKLEAVYGELVESTSDKKTATIKFTDYPNPSHSVSGAGAFTNGTTNGTEITSADYYKYMLMTQGQHLAMEAQYRSKDGSLTQDWLKKHPAADAQYGAVLGENNAVEKEITIDPIYRSFHATGLYLPAGEVVKVRVEGLEPGEKISITINEQNSLAWRGGVDNSVYTSIVKENTVEIQSVDAYFTKADIVTANGMFVEANVTNQSQWAKQNGRMPWITANFVFDHNGEYNIGTAFGGIMHINPGNCYSQVKTTITGAVETPHYILGVTTPDYFETYLKDAPGVMGVLDTENGQIVGPTGVSGTSTYMRGVKKEEIDKLAMLWHSFFTVNESFTGGTYNRNNFVKCDYHVPAGLAVALGGYVYACPTYFFGQAMSYQGLLQSGTWGTLHEIGHNHGGAYGSVWGFGDVREGEVRNNALTLLAYIISCDVGTTIRNGGGAEHGIYANPFSTLSETLNFPKQIHSDIGDGSYGYFQFLGMYANIMHSFGADKFYELLYSYKIDQIFLEKGNVNNLNGGNIREDFNYRCAKIFGMNFTKYFNTYYKANLKSNVYSDAQLAFMNSLPNYEPVANFYAGGIDGVKTAGDYIVAFGEDIVFDLKNTTICSLDTDDKKGTEIISVAKPLQGSIKDNKDGTYTYSFNEKYTGCLDEIKFKVKLSDGIVHEFTIYLRISYNASKLTTYEAFDAIAGGLNKNNWSTVMDKLPSLSSKVTGNPYSYIPNYTTAKGWQVVVAEYYWQAPETGNVTFHFKRDDGVRFYFGNDFDSLEDQGFYSGYSSDWTDLDGEGKKFYVEKGQYYAIKLLNVNTGGGGSASIAYKYEGKNITQIPNNQVFHPDYPLGKEFETYVFEPKYLVSKKDNINLSSSGTDKSDWNIVSAPTNIQDGRYIEEDMMQWNEETKEYENIGTFVTDKWSYLIDGQTNTVFHTSYKDSDIKPPTADSPDIIIIDTGKIQQFNYFAVSTRARPSFNAMVKAYELWISDDNAEYKLIKSGDSLEYKNLVATLKFDQTTGRYLKFVVKGTTGKTFTVISELDAGIKFKTQRIVPATSKLLFTTSGWTDTSTTTTEKHGYMMANSKNQKMVFRFKGDNLALYAAVGEGYGTALVKLDGKYIQTLDFNRKNYNARSLELAFENLEDGVHTLEIITKSSEKVMINLFGISYTAELVNAPNIYLEKGLTITLVVFVLLFAALLALLLCLLFIPKFRKLMGNNRAIAALDRSLEKQSEKRKAKRAEKQRQKERLKEAEKSNNTKATATNKSKTVSAKADDKVVIKDNNKQKPVTKSSQDNAKTHDKKQETSKPATKSVETKKASEKAHANSAAKTSEPKKVQVKKVETEKPKVAASKIKNSEKPASKSKTQATAKSTSKDKTSANKSAGNKTAKSAKM